MKFKNVLHHQPINNNYELKYQNISDADHTKYLAEIIINLWKNPLPDIDLIELQKNLYFN